MRTWLMWAAALASTGSGVAVAVDEARAQPASAGAWEIGPVIRGRSRSVGMPFQPTQGQRGWFVDFPDPRGHVNYLTYNSGPVLGARRIVMRYRIDAAPGTRFVARDTPGERATISLFLQRAGDDWSARGPYGGYRFYAPAHTVDVLTPGEHVMTVDLGGGWTSVNGVPAARDPRAFAEALAEAQGVGIVLGSHSRRGHGVFATGPARLTVLSFQIM